VASPEAIREGAVTDVYFTRTKEILQRTGAAGKRVVAEVHSYGFPQGYHWAVLCGVEEVAWLLEGKAVNVDAAEEGTIFRVMEPVLSIEGPYSEFAVFESALLGMLRQESSVATKAARIKMKATDKHILFFGIRALHPSIAPMVDRAAFIGGCDSVSGVVGAEMIGEKPVGTMPHSLILVVGNQADAWRAFDQTMPADVPRIALCDTLSDERQEALLAAETLGERLQGVRLDTPSSRRGNMRRLVQETRWSLAHHGYKGVKIYVSGGIDEEDVESLRDVADGFGVGTSIGAPPSVDLALDIVEVEGRPFSKRGKLPGRKQVYRCPLFHDTVTSYDSELRKCPACGEPLSPLLKPLIRDGKVVRELPAAAALQKRVLEQLKTIAGLESFDAEPLLG